ncbi:uncharacterized protein LOC124615480 isoform X1 [Schistocerca americana]|uniref:uncharacterized protein LOC124615480 isoform X1 n=1 Tax=Schistocerca americana TaxID=7009 RepID=UPI001F4FFA47|nr:uncharacterized protein LOC124615480 isoform X1 [Schistocerca americana]
MQESIYIARTNFVSKAVDSVEKNVSTRVIRMGTVVKIVTVCEKNESVNFVVKGNEDESHECVVWSSEKSNFIPLLDVLWQAFCGVPSPLDRVRIADNSRLCHELARVDVGMVVNLLPTHENSTDFPVPSIVRYKGPVPEMGSGYYFGLEILGNNRGNCDGTLRGKTYFSCQKYKGVFATLNRIYPGNIEKTLGGMNTHSDAVKLSEIFTDRNYTYESLLSMPSSDYKHYNARNSNYKTTLVLHLREESSTSMSRNIPPKVENKEKLPGVESSNHNVGSGNPFLKVGDRVVWVTDSGPEVGIVRWLGDHTEDNLTNVIVGVEFENPVGSGTGCYNNKQHFQTEPSHGAFLPLLELMKADDFFSKPQEPSKERISGLTSCGEHSHLKLASHGNARYQPSSASTADAGSKGHVSETHMWNNSVAEISEVFGNLPTDSMSKENKLTKCKSDNLCKSEYVFSEGNGYHVNSVKIDNSEQNYCKDPKNNNVSKKTVLVNYPESAPSRGVLDESPRKVNDYFTKHIKPSELKIKHSHSRDIQPRNSSEPFDVVDESWSAGVGSPYSTNNFKDDQKTNRTELLKSCRVIDFKESDLDNFRDGKAAVQLNDFPDHILPRRFSPTNDVTAFLDDSEQSVVPTDLEVGSVVEVRVKLKPHYGVIRWIGTVAEDKKRRKIAGIEMEEDHVGYSDGSFNGRRYFQCRPGKAMFVPLNSCQKDGRFQEPHVSVDSRIKSFGQIDCPVIPGVVPPLRWKGDTESFCGKFRGIQGHHNSCYLDATLFSMFTFTSAFDSLLFRPPTENDIKQYDEVQRVLREEIVNPLRQNLYVRADRVMKLRTLLENLSSVTGLTSEEKDPEEFLTSLVAQILKAEPFLKLSSGQEAYHYQLFVEKDEQLVLPSVQQLFDQSFLTSDIKLKEVPSCLIIQMPRFGKSFKMYPRILPSQLLDVTDIIEDSPRQCTVCGKLAEYECRECFGQFGTGLDSIAFCEECLGTAHSHQRRNNHAWRRLSVPVEFSVLQDHCHIPRLYMELFAVVCIETSHYVAFVKCGSGSEAPWCFFDSMADRKGEQNGYNIPEMVLCPKLPYWLSDEGTRSLQEIKDDRLLPEHAKRLLCDAYMCMYQSPDVMMYR